MSFLRHREIYRPMVTGKTPERSGCDRSGLIGTMSFRLAIPGGLPSGSARFRFTSQAQNALQWSCRSRILQRTVNSVLFDCLSAGVHPTPCAATKVFKTSWSTSARTQCAEAWYASQKIIAGSGLNVGRTLLSAALDLGVAFDLPSARKKVRARLNVGRTLLSAALDLGVAFDLPSARRKVRARLSVGRTLLSAALDLGVAFDLPSARRKVRARLSVGRTLLSAALDLGVAFDLPSARKKVRARANVGRTLLSAALDLGFAFDLPGARKKVRARANVGRTLLSAALDLGFAFDLSSARKKQQQGQNQRQRLRTGVSALHDRAGCAHRRTLQRL